MRSYTSTRSYKVQSSTNSLHLVFVLVKLTPIPCLLLVSHNVSHKVFPLCSHCVMPLLIITYLSLHSLKQLQPINTMLCSYHIKPQWHHTTNGLTQQIHSHTTHMLKSGSTWSLHKHYSPYGDLFMSRKCMTSATSVASPHHNSQGSSSPSILI